MKKIALLLSLITIASCSFKKTDLQNQKMQGHEHLYSEPDALKVSELPKTKKRVVIVSTNDWLGKFQTEAKTLRDDHNKSPVAFSLGGIGIFSSYLKVIRETYPSQTLLVDSGNFLPVGDFDGKIIQQTAKIFSELNYDAITLGTSRFQ